MECAACRQLLDDYNAATKRFARAVALMTASVGNADFNAAMETAEKLRTTCHAIRERLKLHRESHLTELDS